MKIKQRYDGLSIPTWALCYLINADGEGLSDEDRDTVDRWVHSFLPGAFLISVEDGEFFARSPEFGLACTCVKGCVVIGETDSVPWFYASERKDDL